MFNAEPVSSWRVALADLTRDPYLAALFRDIDRDSSVGAEIDRPKPPRRDGAAVSLPLLQPA